MEGKPSSPGNSLQITTVANILHIPPPHPCQVHVPPLVPPLATSTRPPTRPGTTTTMNTTSHMIFWLNGRPHLTHSFLGKGGFAEVYKVELLIPVGTVVALDGDGRPKYDDEGFLILARGIYNLY